jgi:hypothetical protein
MYAANVEWEAGMAPELTGPCGIGVLVVLALVFFSLFIPRGGVMSQSQKHRLKTFVWAVAASVIVLLALFAVAVVNYGSFEVAWEATLAYPHELWVSISLGALVVVVLFLVWWQLRAERRTPNISA